MAEVPGTTDFEILKHRVQELPDHMTSHAKRGFATLNAVEDHVFREFLTLYLESIERGELVEGTVAQGSLKIDKRLLSDVLMATTLATSAVADLEITVDDFVRVATGRLFEPEQTELVKVVVAEALARRTTLQAAMQRSSLTNAVLPAFQAMSIEIDLRVRFDDDMTLKESAPVAIVGFRRDVGDDVFFQMDRDDVNRLVKQMTAVLKKLDAAANLIRNS